VLAVDAFKRYEMDVETYPTTEHVSMMRYLKGVLANHDADVIERFCDYVREKCNFGLHEIGKDYIKQSKEVQS